MITSLALSPSLDITYVVDSLRLGGITRPREVYRVAGGKGLNVARAAAALGGEVRAVAPLGGEIGVLISSLLLDSEVQLTAIDTPGLTRSCVSISADDGERLTELYEPSPPLPSAVWDAVVEAVRELPPDPGGWLVLSGSVPEGTDLAALLGHCREAGYRVAVDSHGPALAALVDDVGPDLVKVNRAEAAELLGVDSAVTAAELARGVRQRAGGLAVVTDGVSGSCAVGASGAFRVMPHSATGRYPVGSGDSFMAGLLVGLDRGDALPDSLRLAAATASANAAVPGAAVFDSDEVDRALQRIMVAPE